MKKQRTLIKRQLLFAFLILSTSCLVVCLRPASAITPPPKKLVVERLNYLVALHSFSPAHPLTQDRLMKLVIDLGRWGDFPMNYWEKTGGPPNCDASITRSSVRRFIQSLTGQALNEWGVKSDTQMPKIAGDELGWWYNTHNTMYRRPLVYIISEKLMPGQSVQVMFRIMHQQGNSINDQPVIEVGHGSATLKNEGPDWIVTSWQVSRNSHWDYYGAE